MLYMVTSNYFKFYVDNYKSPPWDYQGKNGRANTCPWQSQGRTLEKYLGKIEVKFIMPEDIFSLSFC